MLAVALTRRLGARACVLLLLPINLPENKFNILFEYSWVGIMEASGFTSISEQCIRSNTKQERLILRRSFYFSISLHHSFLFVFCFLLQPQLYITSVQPLSCVLKKLSEWVQCAVCLKWRSFVPVMRSAVLPSTGTCSTRPSKRCRTPRDVSPSWSSALSDDWFVYIPINGAERSRGHTRALFIRRRSVCCVQINKALYLNRK